MIFPGQTGIICWKALSRAIIPEKMSTFVSAVQKILYMGDFWDFGSFKNFFSKKIFFRLRIVQFVWKTCFYDFWFFPEKLVLYGESNYQELSFLKKWVNSGMRFKKYWIWAIFGILDHSKNFFRKKIFSTQNCSIRVKNMFLRFSIFFPKKLPQT